MLSAIYFKKVLREMYDLLMDVLTGKVEGFDEPNKRYRKLKRKLECFGAILGPLPVFLSNADSLRELWTINVKENEKLATYKQRRNFLTREYTEYYGNLLKEFNAKPSRPFEHELMFRGIVIESEIGRGGFATVYKAEHAVLEEARAVKKLDPIFINDEEGQLKAFKRFAREAALLSKLNHPNIVKFFDIGIACDYPFIVMECVDGSNLQKLIGDSGRQDVGVALDMMGQIVSGVAEAHSKEIVHRDIKPSNVVWNGKCAKVLDFGVGQWVEHALMTTSRLTTGVLGTYGYMAPELLENPKLVNKNLDCYSLGALFHFVLTGRLLSPGQPEYYLNEASVPRNVINFILKAVSPHEERFKDASEMYEAFPKS